jgi:hypothetical protein
VWPARLAPEPLRSRSDGTACLSAPDPMGPAINRSRDLSLNSHLLIRSMALRNDEPEVTRFRAGSQGMINLDSAGTRTQ